MKFFDPLILEAEDLLAPLPRNESPPAAPWHDLGQNQMILRRDTAFELEGVGFNLVTAAEITDGVVLIGDDLGEILSDRRFARITIVQIRNTGNEQANYDLIKKIDYVKYRIFPAGYMMRSTSRSHKEAVRVSRNAVKDGAAFNRIGSLLIGKYKQIPAVKSVKVIFITDRKADYPAIEKIAEKNCAITETLNHVMNKVAFDCDACRLKAICDEIEGMIELHFSQNDRY